MTSSKTTRSVTQNNRTSPLSSSPLTDLSKSTLVAVSYASHSAHVEMPDGKRYYAKITGHAKDGTVGEHAWTQVARLIGVVAPDIEVSFTPLDKLPQEVQDSISCSGEGKWKNNNPNYDSTRSQIERRGIILSRDWKEVAEKNGWAIVSENAVDDLPAEFEVYPNEHMDIILTDYLMDNTDRHLKNFMYATGVHGSGSHAHPLPFDSAYCFDGRESDFMHQIQLKREGKPTVEPRKDILHAAQPKPFPKWYKENAGGSQDIVKKTVKMYKSCGGVRQMVKDIDDFKIRLRENEDAIFSAVRESALTYGRNEPWDDMSLEETKAMNADSMVETVRNKMQYLLDTPSRDLVAQLKEVE